MHWNNKLRPFIVRSTDDPGGGVTEPTEDLDLNLDEPLGGEPAPDPEPPAFDEASVREQIRAEERQRLQEEIQQQQLQTQRQAQVSTEEDEDAREMEAIAELAASLDPSDTREAEKRRMALAEKRVTRTVQAQYGAQLMASGVQMAVQDARSKYQEEPPEMLSYIENAILELGLQGQIHEHLVKPVRRLAYGAAALDGKLPQQQTKPTSRTIAVPRTETVTTTVTTIPAAIQNDASEFEKHFGKAALNEAMKEVQL